MKLRLSKQQVKRLRTGFRAAFGTEPDRYFSAPGRTELGGNHTDHQLGKVLAAAVNLDTLAAVRENGTDVIRVLSEGYPFFQVLVGVHPRDPEKFNTTYSLVVGVMERFQQMGCKVRGFDAYVTSSVLPGSGLSSSAAFEVLFAVILNSMFFENKLTAPELAEVGMYAENVYFGKPCGLMDQMASAVGNMITIDFGDQEHPVIERVDFDFATCGHALCIIDTRANHADLTEEYAAITEELGKICAHFGKRRLRQVLPAEFYAAIPELRKSCGDRAVLRALHVYRENVRVEQQVEALRQGDFDRYLRLMKESGYSSYMYLQNVLVAGSVAEQAVGLTLGLCETLLDGRGGYRVHGGGFAGTVQAFVPLDMLDNFRAGIEAVLGEGACHVVSIRPQGGTECEV